MFGIIKNYFGGSRQMSADEVIDYVEKYLQIVIRKMVLEAEGEIISDRKSECAYLKMKLQRDMREDLVEQLTAKYGKIQEPESYLVPGYNGHVYASEIESGERKAVCFDMRSFKKMMTRSVELYLVEREGELYLFFMG